MPALKWRLDVDPSAPGILPGVPAHPLDQRGRPRGRLPGGGQMDLRLRPRPGGADLHHHGGVRQGEAGGAHGMAWLPAGPPLRAAELPLRRRPRDAGALGHRPFLGDQGRGQRANLRPRRAGHEVRVRPVPRGHREAAPLGLRPDQDGAPELRAGRGDRGRGRHLSPAGLGGVEIPPTRRGGARRGPGQPQERLHGVLRGEDAVVAAGEGGGADGPR